MGLGESQAQYTFMPNTRRLVLLDSLKAMMQTLHLQPTSLQRDTALFYTLDRYRYHYFDVNRPFAELTRTLLMLPDSMYRIATRNHWQTGLIIAAVRRADAISYLGDKVSAIELYEEALYRCRTQPMPHYQGIALINLAACFAYRKNVSKQDWQQTIAYMKQAFTVAKRSNDIENIHQYYNLMGDFHVINKQYAQALPFYEAEQPLMDKNRHLSGYRTNLAYLGICYLHTNQEEKAWASLRQFFRISNQNEGSYSTYLHHVVLYEIGSFYLRNRKDYQKALIYQRQYEENINERTLFDRIGHYEAMSQIYSGLKNYPKAYLYQQRYLTMRDSLNLDETSRRLADIEHQLIIQRKENQIKSLQNSRLREINITQQSRLFLLAITLLLLVGVLGLITYSTRLKKEAVEAELRLAGERKETDNRIIQTQESERQRIAADLHDDLGGTLAVIRRKITDGKVQFAHSDAHQVFEELDPLIQKSNDDLRRIAHNLMPPEFARTGLRGALEQLIGAIPKQPTQVVFLVSGYERTLPTQVELTVYRIVSELVQNICKHAQARRASVQLLYYTDRLCVEVEDDGVGIDADKLNESDGIGLKNSTLRADYIGALVRRESGKGGTFISVELPYSSFHDTTHASPDFIG